MIDRRTEYATLGMALDGLGSVLTVSELHGGFCGALCAGGAGVASAWLEDQVRESESRADTVQTARDILRVVELETWRALASSDLEFTPLLPEDDLPLDERVTELALWCHGFLSGLALGDLSLADGSSRASKDPHADSGLEARREEIIKDFAEISRAGLNAEERSEPTDADFNLAEIIEYVRVSVQILFEEIGAARADEAGLPASMSEH